MAADLTRQTVEVSFDNFKPTGLGDLPAGWKVVRLGDVLTQRIEKVLVKSDQEYIRLGVRWYAEGPFKKNAVLGSEIKSNHLYTVKPGEFIYNRLFAWKGSFGVISEDMAGCYVSSEFPVFQVDRTKLDPFYLWRRLSLPSIWKTIENWSSGTTRISRLRFKEEIFLDLVLSLPPLDEQRKIAHVLNTVQQAIAAQEDVIAAAQELKRSLLRRLFTYGPGPEPAPTQETEIGEVPIHWQIRKCEDLCENITVGIVLKPSNHYVASGVPAFRSFNIRENRIVPKDLVYISQNANDTKLSKSRLKAGDVLIVRTGYPGTSCVVPKEFDGTNCIDLVIARPDNSLINSRYLSHYFNSEGGRRQSLASKTGLAQQHLNVGAVKQTLIPVPSLDEQNNVAYAVSVAYDKIAAEQDRLAGLRALFDSLLQALMSGRLRVNQLDLNTQEKS